MMKLSLPHRRLLSTPHRLFSTSTRRDANYGFIGLGNMGFGMAQNLRKKLPVEDTVYVFDINPAATAALQQAGVIVSPTIHHLVENSDTVITMLPSPKHVQSVFAALAATPPAQRSSPRLFIDSSTIDIATSLKTADLIETSPALEGVFVDAPVSGGVVGARAGTLTFMVGAPPAIIPRLESVLAHMGTQTLHCGPPGAGLAAKLTNNYLLAVSNVGVCEAMNLGVRLGLEKEVLMKVVNGSSGRCWSSEVNNPLVKEEGGFEGGFGVGLMRKDVGLAVEAAERVGARLVLGGKVGEVYDAVEERERGRDFAVVYRWLKEGGDGV